jgi:hypothetical protein
MPEVQQQLEQAVNEASLILKQLGMDTPVLLDHRVANPHWGDSLQPDLAIGVNLYIHPIALPAVIRELIVLAQSPGAQRT